MRQKLLGVVAIFLFGSLRMDAVTFTENPKQADGRSTGTIRYSLPPYLSDLNNYHDLSYQVSFTDNSRVSVDSRIVLVKSGQREAGVWNKGQGKFSGFSAERTSGNTLGGGNLAIDFELITTMDVRTTSVYLGVYLDGQIIGGWLLNLDYWTPKVSTSSVSASGKKRILLLEDPSTPIVDTLMLDGKEVQEGDFIADTPLISAEVRDADDGIKSWSLMLVREKDNAVVASKEAVETILTKQTLPISFQTSTPLEKGSYRAVVTVRDMGDRVRVVSSNRLEYSMDFGMQNVIVGPTPYNPNKGTLGIEYQLTQSADVWVYVYAIDGERQWETQCFSGQNGGKVGFNRIEWDGKNAFGEALANGMYVVYTEAKGNGKKSRCKSKFLVLK